MGAVGLQVGDQGRGRRARETLTKTFAEVRLFINEDFGRHNVSKWHEHLQDVLVTELLGQVVYEEIGSLWAYDPKIRWLDETEETEKSDVWDQGISDNTLSSPHPS